MPGGKVDFKGPFAQGARGARFVYLSWGVMRRGNRFDMFRRAKILLAELRWQDVERRAKLNQPLVAELTLTDAKGGPLCASVKAPHIRWLI